MGWIKCLKRRYSKREAQGALNKLLSSTRRKEHKETRIYECSYCHHWHLTSKEFAPYIEVDPTPCLNDMEKGRLEELKEKFGRLIK